MGKEVSYCESCGHRLMGDGVLHDGRRYCAACRPTATIPVPVAPRPSSGRLPKAPRRTKESTRLRKKRSLLVPGIAGAAAAAVAVGIALASGGEPAPEPTPVPVVRPAPKPAPPPAPSPGFDELLARVREIREADLMFERRAEVAALLEQAASKDAARKGEADRLAAEYDRKYEETAARLADFARTEALRHAARQRFAEALSSLDGYPEAFRASRAASPLQELRKDLERRRAQAAVPFPAPNRKPAPGPPGTSPIRPFVPDRRSSPLTTRPASSPSGTYPPLRPTCRCDIA